MVRRLVVVAFCDGDRPRWFVRRPAGLPIVRQCHVREGFRLAQWQQRPFLGIRVAAVQNRFEMEVAAC